MASPTDHRSKFGPRNHITVCCGRPTRTPPVRPTGFVLLLTLIVTVLPFGIVVFVRRNLLGASVTTQARVHLLTTSGARARATVLRVEPTGLVANQVNLQCSVQLGPLELAHPGVQRGQDDDERPGRRASGG